MSLRFTTSQSEAEPSTYGGGLDMDNSCMNSSQDHEKTCCCAITHVDTLGLDSIGANAFTGKSLLGFSGLIAAWWVIYSHLEPFSKFFTHMLSRWWTGFSPESHLGSALPGIAAPGHAHGLVAVFSVAAYRRLG